MIKKIFTLLCLCTLCMGSAWGENVTIWSEDWTGAEANAVPTAGVSGTNSSNATYVMANGGGTTKIYNEKLAGGTAPELLVGKSQGSWSITLSSLQGCSGTLTLNFKINNTILVQSNVGTVSIQSNITKDHTSVEILNVPSKTTSLTIKIIAATSSNVRIDDVSLVGAVVEEKPYKVTLFDDNSILEETSIGSGVELPIRSKKGIYSFIGWCLSKKDVPSLEQPTIIEPGQYNPSTDCVLYPIYSYTAQLSGEEICEYSLTTSSNNDWTVSNAVNKSSYYLLNSNKDITSPTFDLSSLSKIIAYVGYYGGAQYATLQISSAGKNYGSVVNPGDNGNSGKTYYTINPEQNPFSGNGNLSFQNIASGATGSNGLRVYKIEIYTKSTGERQYYTSIINSDYERDIVNELGSICLPNDADIEGATLYEISAITMDDVNTNYIKSISFSSVEGAEAGKGYVFKASDSKLVAYYSGSAVENVEANNGIIGNLSASAKTVSDTQYIISGNTVKRSDGTATVGQNRAYIDPTQFTATSKTADFTIEFDTPTAINEVFNKINAEGQWYSIKGEKVARPTTGVFVKNGVKYIFK